MNIRVNAIAPGPTDTEATRTQAGDAAKELVKGLALKRMGQPRGHGRRLPVPALRRGVVGDRPDRQRRRRTGVPMRERRARVGFVGLGNIGKPMALRLLAADGVDLCVYDVAPEPVAELATAGAPRRRRASASSPTRRPGLRDGARRRPGARGARRGRSARRRDGPGPSSIHSTVAPTTPGELADVAGAARRDASSTRRSAAGRWAPPTAPWRSWSAAPTRRSPPAEPRARADGLARSCTPARSGPARGSSWPATCCTSSSFTAATEAQRLAEAAGLDLVALGEVVRHTDAITGGPGAIMHRDTTAPLDPDDFWYGVFEHVARPGREGPRLRHRAGRPARGRRTPGAAGAGATRPGPRRCRTTKESATMTEVRRPARAAAARPGARWRRSTAARSDGAGDFFGYTADHLFADIWNRPGLSDRDRRLLLIGMLAGTGAPDVLGDPAPGGVRRRRARRRGAARDRGLPRATTPAGRSARG